MRLPFFFAMPMPTVFSALILATLFHASLAMATPASWVRSRMVRPRRLLRWNLAGTAGCHIIPHRLPLQRLIPPPQKAASKDQPKSTSGAPASIEPDAASSRSHLSSDPRVNTARKLVTRNRFADALNILRPLAPDHPDQTDVQFLIGLAASRGSQTSELEEETRLALLDEAIAAFRSILIRRPELVRVRLELALAFYLKKDDQLARNHFERALVGRPPAALVANINRFVNIMRARRRWTGYFGFSLAPDTNINAASDAEFIYIRGFPFRRGAQGRGQFGYRRGGLGRRRISVSPGRALAPSHRDQP